MIDYDRLLLIVQGDVHEDIHQDFDLEAICSRAYEKNGEIIVKSAKFMFKYDSETYEQTFGAGC